MNKFNERVKEILRKNQEEKPMEVIFKPERINETSKLIVEFLIFNKYKEDDSRQELFSNYVYILSNENTSYEEYEATYKKAKHLIHS